MRELWVSGKVLRNGVILGIWLCFVLCGCSTTNHVMALTPTIAPTQQIYVEHSPTPPPTAAVACQESSIVQSIPNITETEAPAVIGNNGSNIENGGLALFHNSYVYFIDHGMHRFETYGESSLHMLDIANMAYLNLAGDKIYYVTTDDYRIHTYNKVSSEIIDLNINGAYNLLVFGEYLYYQYAIGEQANMHMYRARLDGSEVTDMGFAATNFCPDDKYIYLSNLDDNGHLYKYDVTTGEIIKVKSDTVSQINVVGDRIYYIAQNDDHQIVAINKTGAGREIIIDEPCVSLNHMKDSLVFTRRDSNDLEIYHIDDSSLETLLSYPNINGITVADDWIFFEVPLMLDGYSGFFRVQSKNGKVIPPLPQTNLVKVVGYDSKKSTLFVDVVEYMEGEEAIQGYAEEKGVSESRAKRRLEEFNVDYFIRNRVVKVVSYHMENFAHVQLYTIDDETTSEEGYIASSEDIFRLLENDETLLDRLVLTVTTIGDKIIRAEEYPLS